ncbi:MAG: beta-propeller fold lactonase family protein [Mobilicoccus sp.]|nr:beta-propeller fold lactonase family protein [Mobilicoccus sp.]
MSSLVLVANAGDGTITSLRLHDGDSPRLETLTTTTVGDGCGTLAIDHERGLVYAATKQPHVVTLRVDTTSGELTELSRTEVHDTLAYIALARGGEVALGASYDGACGLSWPVRDGVLGERASKVEHANAHCILPVGEHAYVVALGDDEIAQYRIGEDATLTPLDPATVTAPEGSGPRHLVVDGDDAYLVTEFSAEAIRFEVAPDGTLTRREAARIDDPSENLGHSDIDADPVEKHYRWGAEVKRAGRWLLCSERTASTIATVEVDDDGTLGEVVAIARTEKQPRAFGVTPDGQYVVSVGEKSTRASLCRIEDDGFLTEIGHAEVGDKARWVEFV